jgi:hypothetical protein
MPQAFAGVAGGKQGAVALGAFLPVAVSAAHGPGFQLAALILLLNLFETLFLHIFLLYASPD